MKYCQDSKVHVKLVNRCKPALLVIFFSTGLCMRQLSAFMLRFLYIGHMHINKSL